MILMPGEAEGAEWAEGAEGAEGVEGVEGGSALIDMTARASSFQYLHSRDPSSQGQAIF